MRDLRAIALLALLMGACTGELIVDSTDATVDRDDAIDAKTDAIDVTVDGIDATVDASDVSDAAADVADVTAVIDVGDVAVDASDVAVVRDVAVDARDAAVVRDVAVDARDAAVDTAPPPRCRTRVSYGEAWMHPADHVESFDDTDGLVTWDGVCHDDGANSYAVLSNGWRPYFSGRGRCSVDLDATECAGVTAACSTRFTYGSAWVHGSGHPSQFDDTGDLADWDGVCHADGSRSFAVLSNGWRPYFSGAACDVSVRHTQCATRYSNPVIGGDCPDPGVLRDGDAYYLVCTSGNAASAFPIWRSRDLSRWTSVGHVFPSGRRPSWAASDFWAPEIHRVGSRYVAYFTARRAGGQLCVGAASASSPLGPFTDLGRPLLYDASMGLIDATVYEHSDGALYIYWKEDGNAVGRATPIHGQRLAADGLSVTGSAPSLISNDLAWEGNLVEGPWVVSHGGSVYLFYSANAYYDGRYAVGVARSSSPLGPFTKRGAPILASGVGFVGPGHGSVIEGPSGDDVLVYHAWRAGFVNGRGDGREVLVDRVAWSAGWPTIPGAPSEGARGVP